MMHTPGPRRVESPFGPTKAIGDMEVVGRSGATVASIPCGYAERAPEREANARLIAQAPTMLAVLQRMVDPDCAGHGQTVRDAGQVLALFTDEARSILRAVEGST